MRPPSNSRVVLKRFAWALTSVPGVLAFVAVLVAAFLLASVQGLDDVAPFAPIMALYLTMFIWARKVSGRTNRDERRLRGAVAELLPDEPVLRLVFQQERVRRPKPRCLVLTPTQLIGVQLNWTGRKAIGIEFVDKLGDIEDLGLRDTTIFGDVPAIELVYQTPQGRRSVLFPTRHQDEVRALWRTLHGKAPLEAEDAELLEASPIRRWYRDALRPGSLALTCLAVAAIAFWWHWGSDEASTGATPRSTLEPEAASPTTGREEVKVGDCLAYSGGEVAIVPCESSRAVGKLVGIGISAATCPSARTDRTIAQFGIEARTFCLGPVRGKSVGQARAGDCLRVTGDVFSESRVVACRAKGAQKILEITKGVAPSACPRATAMTLQLTRDGFFRVLCLSAAN